MAPRGRPRSAKPRDAVHGAKRKPTLSTELAILTDEAAELELIRLVRDMVPYTSFLTVRPPLEIRRYRALRNLVILQELFHIEDADICARLIVTQKLLDDLRTDPHYDLMTERVRGVVERLSSPRKLAEWAADQEDSLALSLVKTALWDGSTRDRTQAMNSLLDRVSAKKGREEGEREAGAPPISEEFLGKLMEMSMSVGLVLGKNQAGGISGSTLNVPRLVGSGETQHTEEE